MLGCMVDMFHAWLYGRYIERETSFIEQIKGPVFILATVIMLEPHSSLGEKVNPSILKDDFSSRTGPSIFRSIAPVLLDRSNGTS